MRADPALLARLHCVSSALNRSTSVAFLQRQDIARFKLPERLEIVIEFPISPAGKLLRRELRARIAQLLQSESS